jgi:alpha-1,3-glucan synthase
LQGCQSDSDADIQDFTHEGQKLQDVWLVFHNNNTEVTYSFDCSGNQTGLLAPFDKGTTVKNLFYPYDEVTLDSVPQKLSEL